LTTNWLFRTFDPLLKIRAVTALNDGVPAIAVSTEINFATNDGLFAETGAFVVHLVAALQI